MALSTPPKLLSPQDYLAFEERASERHEYVDGLVYALPGETLAHNEVAGNLYTLLRSPARRERCRVAFEGVKLAIPALNRYYYPDIMVLCDPKDTGPLIFQRPCFIAEILSPSTEATDRREKAQAYKSIETLHGYAMIDPQTRSLDYLERTTNGWQISHCDEGSIHVDCLRLELSLNSLFD